MIRASVCNSPGPTKNTHSLSLCVCVCVKCIVYVHVRMYVKCDYQIAVYVHNTIS